MPVEIDKLLLAPFSPVWLAMAVFGVAGGVLTAMWTYYAMSACGLPDRGWSRRVGVLGVLLCAAFVGAMLRWHCQETPMVRPSGLWWHWRIGHHVVLIALMLAVTATDLRGYLIPDLVTLYGLVWGLGMAVVSGDLQLEHAWCDWNQEVPQIQGAYIPAWMAQHPHLHGLVWSLCGALAGAGGIWIVRGISSKVIGQETMGLGDVTLMAMIGSFLGWQPVVFVLLLAPLCALVWQVVVRGACLLWYVVNRARRTGAGSQSQGLEVESAAPQPTSFLPYIPYGPYLCLATYFVLLTWKWIWMFELSFGLADRTDDRLATFAVRRLFGDWVSLAVIATAMLGGLAVLLMLRRAYQSIPVTRRRAPPPDEANLPKEATTD